MDITARKTAFVKAFMELQSEELISQFERLLRKSNKSESENYLSPFTEEGLNSRASIAEEDYKNGRYKTAEEIKAKYQF